MTTTATRETVFLIFTNSFRCLRQGPRPCKATARPQMTTLFTNYGKPKFIGLMTPNTDIRNDLIPAQLYYVLALYVRTKRGPL